MNGTDVGGPWWLVDQDMLSSLDINAQATRRPPTLGANELQGRPA
jgi:hypothetical protein